MYSNCENRKNRNCIFLLICCLLMPVLCGTCARQVQWEIQGYVRIYYFVSLTYCVLLKSVVSVHFSGISCPREVVAFPKFVQNLLHFDLYNVN